MYKSNVKIFAYLNLCLYLCKIEYLLVHLCVIEFLLVYLCVIEYLLLYLCVIEYLLVNLCVIEYLLVLFCCFTSQVNSYGHCGTVSSLNHTFSWAGLNKGLTSNLCTYFHL